MARELTEKSGIEISLLVQTQREFTDRHHLPHFAPQSGVCHRCGRNVFQNYRIAGSISNGIDEATAGIRLITGCPHCHASFCD